MGPPNLINEKLSSIAVLPTSPGTKFPVAASKPLVGIADVLLMIGTPDCKKSVCKRIWFPAIVWVHFNQRQRNKGMNLQVVLDL